VKPPPCIQTITGNFGSFVAEAGAQIFRKRQSSEKVVLEPGKLLCGQLAHSLVASRTSFHGTTGCGGRQRFSPTGGAAKGIPLKLETSPSVTPRTTPEAILISGAPEALLLVPVFALSISVWACREHTVKRVNIADVIFMAVFVIGFLLFRRKRQSSIKPGKGQWLFLRGLYTDSGFPYQYC
jgi:hypothetical protein